MATVLNEPNAQVIFLDDEPSFLETIQNFDSALPLNFFTTEDARQSLEWVEKGIADALVSDLRMPGPDGVSVLEEAYRKRPGMRLILLTSHELSQEQETRLRRIGAVHYSKGAGLLQLLTDLTTRFEVTEPNEIARLRKELENSRALNKEFIKDFIAELREIPEPEKSLIVGGNHPFTVAELIDDLERQTDRGVEHVRLWLRAFGTLRQLGRNR